VKAAGRISGPGGGPEVPHAARSATEQPRLIAFTQRRMDMDQAPQDESSDETGV
jgi:hypothetical protein